VLEIPKCRYQLSGCCYFFLLLSDLSSSRQRPKNQQLHMKYQSASPTSGGNSSWNFSTYPTSARLCSIRSHNAIVYELLELPIPTNLSSTAGAAAGSNQLESSEIGSSKLERSLNRNFSNPSLISEGLRTQTECNIWKSWLIAEPSLSCDLEKELCCQFFTCCHLPHALARTMV
jgi:hypothetical protein